MFGSAVPVDPVIERGGSLRPSDNSNGTAFLAAYKTQYNAYLLREANMASQGSLAVGKSTAPDKKCRAANQSIPTMCRKSD